jgi:hypothetical protein
MFDKAQLTAAKIELLHETYTRVEASSLQICFALHNAWATLAPPNYDDPRRRLLLQARIELERYIMRKLAPHVYYSEWLAAKQSLGFNQLNSVQKNNVLRQGRLSWINYMIKKLESQ